MGGGVCFATYLTARKGREKHGTEKILGHENDGRRNTGESDEKVRRMICSILGRTEAE